MEEVRRKVDGAATAYRDQMRNTRECSEGGASDALMNRLSAIGEEHGVDDATLHRMLGEALWAAPE